MPVFQPDTVAGGREGGTGKPGRESYVSQVKLARAASLVAELAIGFDGEEVDEADGALDRKTALTDLIARHEEERRLRVELSAMSPRVLIRRAEDMGVADEASRHPRPAPA